MQDMQEVLGFFDVMGAEEALQIVTGNHQNTPGWYATAVNLGATDDALI